MNTSSLGRWYFKPNKLQLRLTIWAPTLKHKAGFIQIIPATSSGWDSQHCAVTQPRLSWQVILTWRAPPATKQGVSEWCRQRSSKCVSTAGMAGKIPYLHPLPHAVLIVVLGKRCLHELLKHKSCAFSTFSYFTDNYSGSSFIPILSMQNHISSSKILRASPNLIVMQAKAMVGPESLPGNKILISTLPYYRVQWQPPIYKCVGENVK